MRIAYGTFGKPITYGDDSLLGTAGGVNMFSRYIKELCARHTVFPIVPLTRKSLPWPGVQQRPIQEADVVIIENGPNSLLSAFKKVPAITYLLSQLAEYSGPVIYLQSDPDLPFSFYPENFTPKWYQDGPDSQALQRYTKEWHIVTSCRNLDRLKERCSGRRYQYQNAPPNTKFHTVELHDVLADPDIKFDTTIQDSTSGVYIGGERRLCRKFIEYSYKYDMFIYGKWKEESLAKLGNEFTYMGVLEDGEVYRIYGDFQTSLVMGNPDYEDVGMVAARFWETGMSGCLPLLDAALPDPTGGLALRVSPINIAKIQNDMTGTKAKTHAAEIRQKLIHRNTSLGTVMERVLGLV